MEALASGRDRAVDVLRAEFRGFDGTMVTRYVINVISAGGFNRQKAGTMAEPTPPQPMM